MALNGEFAAAQPDVSTPDLPESLNNLADFLGKFGRREATLSDANEATVLYRKLAFGRPDIMPGLARS